VNAPLPHVLSCCQEIGSAETTAAAKDFGAHLATVVRTLRVHGAHLFLARTPMPASRCLLMPVQRSPARCFLSLLPHHRARSGHGSKDFGASMKSHDLEREPQEGMRWKSSQSSLIKDRMFMRISR
jgi:hypothetical protein